VIEKFLGIEHVTDTSSSSLKQALDGIEREIGSNRFLNDFGG
jgi:hypothetical protein